MAEIKIETPPVKRTFDGGEYILTKINYTKEAAKEDEAYHKERGRKTRILEKDGYWLLYTKIGE